MKSRLPFNRLGLLLLLLVLFCCGTLHAFRPSPTPNNPLGRASSLKFEVGQIFSSRKTFLQAASKQDEKDMVEIGSKEYIQGMMSRSVEEEPIERVTGDKVLGPTLRLAGGVTGVLVALVLAFLFSNGII
eukprot:scaffold5215_cov181-Amphora_coffeaeformis.AAC.5